MIDPNGSESTDEFIEVYNNSDSTIKLTDYYYLINDDTLSILAFPDSTLEAEHYGIILDPDYDTTSGNYSGLIPDSVVQFTVGGSGFSLTNSSPKLIQILSESFALIDSHLTGNSFPSEGHSDERIKYDKNLWKSSLNINGTPGFKNSVSPDEYELKVIIDSCYFFDNEIIGTGEIINIGLNDISSIDLQVWNDFNFDSIYTSGEFKYSKLINDTLHSEDTTTFNFSLSYDLLGSNQIFAKVKNSTHNISDSTFKNVSVPLNEGDLLINEFYPIPVKIYAAEYLEIYSNTAYPVNLKNIKIADNIGSAVITNENNILRSHEYFVAVKDSSLWQLYSKPGNWLQLSNLPSQNNSEDLIEIRNSNDLVIDMVDYKSLWDTGDDIAFERLSELLPSNESSSWAKTDTGSPGFKNNNQLAKNDLIATISDYNYSNDLINLDLTIQNYSQNASSLFDINYCIDTDLNSKMTGETIYSTTVSEAIQPIDTMNISLSIPPYFKGANRVIVELDYSEDEDTTNNVDSEIINVPLDSNDFVITEFVYAPGDIHSAEYFEILSQSEKPINFLNLRFSDLTDTVTIENEVIVEKDSFYVFTESVELTESFPDLENVCVMDNWRSLNNTSDQILLTDFYDNYIDKVIYTSDWNIPSDYSAELISPKLNNNDKSNWKAVQPGSPGFENYSQLVEYNLIATISDYNYSNDLINFDVTVQNYSQNASSLFNINYCIDTDLNSKMTGETIYSTTVSEAIQPIDTMNISLSIPPYFKGANRVIVELDYSEDEDTTNNVDSEIINVPLDSNDFVITEFVYAPGDIHSAEYFEILSQSEKPINFLNLRFSDLTDTVTIENEVIVEKDSFYVFTESVELTESFPDLENVCVMDNWRSLNNTSDQILLTDFYDNYIDKVIYTSDWNILSDYSAELINPQLSSNDGSNWKAVQPGSPGKTNPSFAKDNEVLLYAISIEDSVEINKTISFSCVAKNIGQENINGITLQFFIDENADSIYSSDEKTFSITQFIAIAPGDSTIITQHFTYDKVGFFDVKFFVDYSDNYYETLKIKYSEVPIILNEIMPSPNLDESEWIELVNISDENVNLRGWQIGDNQSYSIISNKNLFLEKNEYLVISKDNNVMYNYPQCDGVFQSVDMPNLNSYDDKVRLKDFCGRVVDTMAYRDSISAKAEISFERKGEAIDRDWGYCENEFGGTPGRENSLLQNTYSIAMISDNDYFYFNDTTKNFIIQFVNDGYKQLNDLEMRIFYNGAEVFQDSILANDPGDTIDITISDNLDFEDGLNNYEVIVNSDEVNYTDSILVFKSFSEEQIFLNEVLFDPNTLYNQVEFIEFYLPNKTLNTQCWKLQVNNNIEEMNLNFNSKYVVVTKDTILQNTFPNIEIKYMENFPTLTNDGALLKIIDPSGFCVDSVDLREYDEIESGVSLEKSYQNISSSNKYIWKRSVSSTGFSPGVKNSITADSSNGNKITIIPEIFCPATAIIPLEIKIESEIGMSFVELKIFDLRGRKLYSKEMNCFSQPTLKIFWDGKTDYDHYPTIGMYLVFVKVKDVNDKTHEYKKTLIVGD